MQHQRLSSIASAPEETEKGVRNAWTSYHTKGCTWQQPLVALGRSVRSISQNQIFWCSANVLSILPTGSMNETEWRTNFPTRISRSSRPASCIPFTSTQTQEDYKWSRRKKNRLLHPCLHKHHMMFNLTGGHTTAWSLIIQDTKFGNSN